MVEKIVEIIVEVVGLKIIEKMAEVEMRVVKVLIMGVTWTIGILVMIEVKMGLEEMVVMVAMKVNVMGVIVVVAVMIVMMEVILGVMLWMKVEMIELILMMVNVGRMAMMEVRWWKP